MGEHVLGPLEDREIRMSTGFAAGGGYTYQGLCGTVAAGVMIIGGLLGRTSPDGDDDDCQQLTALYRSRFEARFGTLICGELREEKYGSGGAEPCSALVRRASALLLECIEDFQADRES